MGSQCSTPQSAPWYAPFFLDPGIRWCRMKIGDISYMHAVPWIALVLLLVRSILENCIGGPLGYHFRLSDRTCSVPERNDVLQQVYNECKSPGEEMLHQLAQQISWTPYQVHKWFWRARQCMKPSRLTKFKESCWRFLVYFCTSVAGVCVVVKEDFFWDRLKCYENFPANTPSHNVMCFWAFQLAFYISLLVSHQGDVRRSDYRIMLVHHIATAVLLAMSYAANAVQIGTLIILAHDISDVPLELAKILKYVNQEQPSQYIFLVFGFLFFVTRMIIYPFYLIKSVILEYPVIHSHAPAWWITLILLLLLLIMHIYWFYLIVEMIVSFLKDHTLEKDIRSDSEYSAYPSGTMTMTGTMTGTEDRTESSQLRRIHNMD